MGADDIDPNKMTVAQLKAALKERGLSVKGKKNVLVKRLAKALEEGDTPMEDAAGPAEPAGDDKPAAKADDTPKKDVDVEMTDATDGEDKKEEEAKPLTPEELAAQAHTKLVDEIKSAINLLERCAENKEVRFLKVPMRVFTRVRRRVTADALCEVIEANVHADTAAVLSAFVRGAEGGMNVDEAGDAASSPDGDSTIPEVRAYLHLLVVVFLVDNKAIEAATVCVTALLDYMRGHNRHTLNPLIARGHYYYARSHELAGNLSGIRADLMTFHRTACLRHNEHSQAVLLNYLLRSLIRDNLYEQADKLVLKATFPPTAPNAESARFAYYLGRIKAVQMNYDEAYTNFASALRKAPAVGAIGFKTLLHKMTTIVQLLNGDVPERAIFRDTTFAAALVPYYELTASVRVGDLSAFHSVTAKYESIFRADRTYTLILRLRHNVIKVGLRKLNRAYSKISLVDVCERLALDSPEDAEFIVAKAIRDGVIDAVINHDDGYVRSKESVDVYSTTEPQELFATRINFCLKLHNEAVKALRFPERKKTLHVEDDTEVITAEDVMNAMDSEDEDPPDVDF